VNRSAQAVQIAIAGTIEVHSTTRSRRADLSSLCSIIAAIQGSTKNVMTRMITPRLRGVKNSYRLVGGLEKTDPYWGTKPSVRRGVGGGAESRRQLPDRISGKC
jgi:hypothetical protein